MDPSRILFSTAVTLNSHHRCNRNLKEKLGKFYAHLIDHHMLLEEYISSYAMLPLSYRQSILQANEQSQSVEQDEAKSTVATTNPRKRLRIGFVSLFLFNPAAGLFKNELIPR